jgi:putative multiple sugar transport system ATP-binding protein
MLNQANLLEMKNITKIFPGVKALDNVNLLVKHREIHALVGENGAGKSTLMNILSGVYPHDSFEGSIVLDGEECMFRHIKQSEKKGIVIIHQELALIPYLSIAENMYLGNEQCGTVHGVIDWNKTVSGASTHMKKVGLYENPNTLIADLGVGKQQLVEIAKALVKDVKLLILDEPTAALNDKESEELLELLLDLKKNGTTAIIISHKINEVVKVADTITVIRDGEMIETLSNDDNVSEDRIISDMVGRKLSDRFPARKHEPGDEIFRVENWNVYDQIIEKWLEVFES